MNIYRLEELIAEELDAARIPGLALAVVSGREIVYARGFGHTSVEEGRIPVTPETLFSISSITKSLTGTLVMRLVEDGTLHLDWPISVYLPWLTLSEPMAVHAITLRMLLSHTAGLANGHAQRNGGGHHALDAHIREDLPRVSFVAPPGRLFSYSEAGMHLAGYLAQAVSETPFTDLMQKVILGPLEMRRTLWDPSVAMTYPCAQGHLPNTDGSLRVDHQIRDNPAAYPATGAFSTALDLAHFALLHVNSGRVGRQQILAPESVAAMHRMEADLRTVARVGYGLTFELRATAGTRRVGHPGGGNAFASMLDMAPDAGAAMVLLWNRQSGAAWKAASTILDSIYDQLVPAIVEHATPDAIAPERGRWPWYTGAYLSPEAGLASIGVADNDLTLEWNGTVVPLRAWGADRYAGPHPEDGAVVSVGFLCEDEVAAQHIVVNTVPFRRIDRDPACVPANPSLHRVYAGTYTDGTWTATVRSDSNVLWFGLAGFRDVACVPLATGQFACSWGLVVFPAPGQDGTQVLLWRDEISLKRLEDAREPHAASSTASI